MVVNRPQRAVIWRSYPVCHYPRPVIVEHCHPWRPAPARVQIVHRDYERRADYYRVSRPTPNAHVQRGPERVAPPRTVASSDSGTRAIAPSPRPAASRGRDVAAGIPANAEVTVRLDLDTGDLNPAGFRLDLLAAPAP